MQLKERRDTGARVLIAAASLVVVIAGLKFAASVILPFLISLFLAMITLPLLNWLTRKKIPRPLAVIVTMIVALAVLSGIFVPIAGSLNRFQSKVPAYKERLEVMSQDVLEWFEERGLSPSDQLARIGIDMDSVTGLVNPADVLDVATGTLGVVGGVLSNVLLVILTIIFILSEAAGFPAKLETAFGGRIGSDRYEKIKLEVQKYLGIKTIVSLITGITVSDALTIIGVDFPLLWGLLAFLLNYIPTFGSIIAAVPPVLLAIVQLGPGHAIAVGIVFVSTNLVLGNFVEPYFMGRRLGLSTLVVFVSLVFWGWVWGPVGMLLSVPLTMILKIMLENNPNLQWVAVLLGPSPRSESSPG